MEYINHLQLLLDGYPHKQWDWECLSKNTNITIDDISDNPDLPRDWELLSSNKFEKHHCIIKRKKQKTKIIIHKLLLLFLIPDISIIICNYTH